MSDLRSGAPLRGRRVTDGVAPDQQRAVPPPSRGASPTPRSGDLPPSRHAAPTPRSGDLPPRPSGLPPRPSGLPPRPSGLPARQTPAPSAASSMPPRPRPLPPLEARARARPDPNPLRLLIAFAGIASTSAIATAMLPSVLPAGVANGASGVSATQQQPAVRHVTHYVTLQPGQTAPPNAPVVVQPTPTPQVQIVTRTRQSGR